MYTVFARCECAVPQSLGRLLRLLFQGRPPKQHDPAAAHSLAGGAVGDLGHAAEREDEAVVGVVGGADGLLHVRHQDHQGYAQVCAHTVQHVPHKSHLPACSRENLLIKVEPVEGSVAGKKV